MRSTELKPTHKNILTTLQDNILDRNEEVWYFAHLCTAQEGHFSIALDAKWGSGKTFFVKQVQMLLDAFNPMSTTLPPDEKLLIQSIFTSYINHDNDLPNFIPHVCIYYDAWSNDNDVDPILSLIYEIIRNSSINNDFTMDRNYKKIISDLIGIVTGREVTAFVDSLQKDDPLSKIKKQKTIHSMIDTFLTNLLKDKGERLILFIDELDRCKPSYAIKLLERIKHYFTNDKITFVFSVYMEALQHTVKHYYGEAFDSCRYLDKFFDLRPSLPPANMEQYYHSLGMNHFSNLYDATCKAVIEYFAFDLREIAKFFHMRKIAALKIAYSNRTISFPEDNGLHLSTCLMVPLMMGLKMVDVTLYSEFIAGKNPQPLLNLLGSQKFLLTLIMPLLVKSSVDTPSQTDITNTIHAMYNAIFANKEETTWNPITIGNCSFSRQTYITITKAASMISRFAIYK